ncbi:MAG: hypothetical protein ACXABY_09190 [Candidatus Thorarchaeota archaeon]|jgi:hypothetical protein
MTSTKQVSKGHHCSVGWTDKGNAGIDACFNPPCGKILIVKQYSAQTTGNTCAEAIYCEEHIAVYYYRINYYWYDRGKPQVAHVEAELNNSCAGLIIL